MEVAQFIVLIFGVFFTVYQISVISDDQTRKSIDRSTFYFDRLNSGTNRKISIAIENNNLLSRDITADQIDNFLNDLHDVGESLEKGLITPQDACDNYSDIAIKAYKNTYIKNYLEKVRKDDENYFQGFDSLYKFLISNCN
jgi:hypothetical protein